MGQNFDDPNEPSLTEFYSEEAQYAGCLLSEFSTVGP
jgi:hypothetical protein